MTYEHQLSAFRAKFRVIELSLVKYEHWELSLRPQQLTLGSMVLSVKENFCTFLELDSETNAEMGRAFADAEGAAKEIFGSVRINILCLMLQDPLIHFHIFPRYDEPKGFLERTWYDKDWPRPPVLRDIQTNNTTLSAIFREVSSSRRFVTDFKAQ